MGGEDISMMVRADMMMKTVITLPSSLNLKVDKREKRDGERNSLR